MATFPGDPATELARVADDVRADAIVVGRSSDSARHLLGSVPRRLVRHAGHPVIVVP
ncbi:MAG: universal stress protein [Acidimicrobiales bacterium]